MLLDADDNDTKWQDAAKLEMQHMNSFKVFKDLGADGEAAEGCKHIRVHLVCDVKHDGGQRARLQLMAI